MNDVLLQHLYWKEKRDYFPDDYNHFVGFMYEILGECVRTEASKLKLDLAGFTWSKGNKVIESDVIDAPKEEQEGLARAHRVALDKILSRDEVVQRYTQILTSTPDEIVLEFVDPAAPTE